jgi:stage II sporulation protein GA (sporulation sigma-E factor processing peptidase)
VNIIYIDLLVIINLYITYFLLKGTAVFLHRKIPTGRLLTGAFTGGATSLIILLPPLGMILNSGLKLAAGVIIVLITFGYKSGEEFRKNLLIFIIINVIFAGATLLLWFFVAPAGMQYNNGFAYFEISFVVLVGTTSAAYGLIRLLRYVLDAKSIADREFSVEITLNGKTAALSAIADSGNLLTDYFSGLPVVICPQAAIMPPEKFRLLPYNTIDSSGLIPVFRVDEIVIKSDNMPDKRVNALVGVTQSNTPCVFNPKLLI